MKLLRSLGAALSLLLLLTGPVRAQTWHALNNTAPFGAGVPLLLTDGTVMVQAADTGNWWKLAPDSTGSYINGTWSALPSLPSGYGPLYFGSAVLADGRVVVIGGEYNFGSSVWTNQGAIYDPVANTWTTLAAPSGWGNIGDAECCVLPNGQFMLADPFNTNQAILDPSTLTWTAVGSGKTDRFDEEGWALLPDGTVLTVDAINAPAAERYITSTGTWISAGSTPQSLEDSGSQELGPMVLRPNGTLFATGATGHTAIYTPSGDNTGTGTWVAGPDFPIVSGQQLDIADGPACLLPDGNVLCGASPGVFNAGTSYFEFDGTNLNPTAAPPNAASESSYVGNMLMLPTGQVLLTDFSSDVEIYTAAGSAQSAWRPTISNCPSIVFPGNSYSIQGTQFNGLSQCSAYGDDSTNATNYPIVRITNNSTGDVFYCRTSGHSTMAVATGAAPTSTNFFVPAGIEIGPSTLQVVANGIASTSFAVDVQSATAPQVTSFNPTSLPACSVNQALTVIGTGFANGDVVNWTVNGNTTVLNPSSVSPTQLGVTVPGSLLTNPGSASVTVSDQNGDTSNSLSISITTPVPELAGLDPAYVNAGHPTYTLSLKGGCFLNTSVAYWTVGGNSTALTTTFVSASLLQATVPASFVTQTGTAGVSVTTPGGGTSATKTETIVGSFGITALSPGSCMAGTSLTLVVKGGGFLNGATVAWNGNPVPTTFGNSHILTATIPTAYTASGNVATITAVNPGNVVSNSLPFTVINPAPTITNISPNVIPPGSPATLVTVTGTNYVPTSTVKISGKGLTTTFVSSTELQVTVPATYLVHAKTYTITVVNGKPGGGVSNGVTLTVGSNT